MILCFSYTLKFEVIKTKMCDLNTHDFNDPKNPHLCIQCGQDCPNNQLCFSHRSDDEISLDSLNSIISDQVRK